MSSTTQPSNQPKPSSASSPNPYEGIQSQSVQPEPSPPEISQRSLTQPPIAEPNPGLPLSQPQGSTPITASQPQALPPATSQSTTSQVTASQSRSASSSTKTTKSPPLRVEIPKAETLTAEIAADNLKIEPPRPNPAKPQPAQSKASQTNPQLAKPHRSESTSGATSAPSRPYSASIASPQTPRVTQPKSEQLRSGQLIAHKSTVRLLHTSTAQSRTRSRGGVFMGAIALVGVWIVLLHTFMAQITLQTPIQVVANFLNSPQVLQLAKPNLLPKAIPTQVSNQEPTRETPIATYPPGYGHFLHREASPEELMIIGSYSQEIEQRYERLNQEAGLALLTMLDAARRDGVWLVPISGFRDFARQEMLFQIQIEQVGSPAEAARSVAPTGYSEHHTGYAVDLADGLARARDLSLAFGNTPAFEWLTRHANQFGFELSFPENNPQGVTYEPWHWRFVGSPAAIQTFAQARAIAAQ